MPQVDFYVLDTDNPAARREFVARLLGKIQHLGKTAWIAVADEEEAQVMDRLLWEFPPESFLPHAVHTSSESTSTGGPSTELTTSKQNDAPVLISSQAQAQPLPEVYVNLRDNPPPQHGELQRVVEVVLKREASALDNSRRNYQFYREQGYQIKSHDIRT